MNHHASKKYKNVCPRNCPSSCTIISHIENGSIHHIAGDISHPYTKGKLCAKGFSYAEKNNHRERLKYPYYQKVKGSGKYIQITWEKAFQLIVSEMLNIYKHYDSFLPVALFKGSGNIGVHHFVAEEFFSSIGETTRIFGSSSLYSGFPSIEYDTGAVNRSDPSALKESSMIMIWGTNPAATNIHLIPYILDAKIKGAKIVVIDPLYTQTAELADLFIQIRPSTDEALACLLIKHLLEKNTYDKKFVEINSVELNDYIKNIKEIDEKEYLLNCDLSQEAFTLLSTWLTDSETVAYVIGSGMQKHSNFEQTFSSIETLAAVHGDIGKIGGGIYFRSNDTMIFNNQTSEKSFEKNRILKIHEMSDRVSSLLQSPIKMLWVSCANPLTQEPNSSDMKRFLREIPFVITVDQFMTPTAQMSNLILPTTTHFEEMDIVVSWWHKEIALNEKAISPFYESRSEWRIMTELAERLNQQVPSLSSFPIYSSEEDYLNAQMNDQVFHRYSIKNISDLKERCMTGFLPQDFSSDGLFPSKTAKVQHFVKTAKQHAYVKPMMGKMPPMDYPFWLITPHHSHTFNSQFHFLKLSDEKEAFVGINPKAAKDLGITNGEIIQVFNHQACIEIKAVYSNQVPKDIVMVYQGWHPDSEMNINELVPIQQADIENQTPTSNHISFYDTFVNIQKL